MAAPSPTETRDAQILLAVAAIPSGRVATYGGVALAAGLPRQARLVGRILSRLPAGSTLPWHRVVNAQGRLSLPAGSAERETQIARLRDEGVEVIGGRIDLRRFGIDAPAAL